MAMLFREIDHINYGSLEYCLYSLKIIKHLIEANARLGEEELNVLVYHFETQFNLFSKMHAIYECSNLSLYYKGEISQLAGEILDATAECTSG